MTDDLIALLDGLGITEKVALVGTAVGGAIALHTAFRLPERVAACVVTSPATSIPPANRAATLERVAQFERDGVRVAFEATAANGYPEEMRTDPARFAAWRARWLANDPSSFAAIYRMLRDTDLRAGIASIKCPVLAIGGEFDRGRPPARVEPIAQAIPGAHIQGAAGRTLCGLAEAPADGGRDRRFSGFDRRVATPSHLSPRSRSPARRARRRCRAPLRRRASSPDVRRIRRATAARPRSG